MARKSIGSLVAELILKDGNFSTKLESSAKKTQDVSDRMSASLRRVGTAAVVGFGLVASAAAGATSVGIVKASKDIAELKRQSDRLGLSSEVWSTYAFAAKKTGTSLEHLEEKMLALNKAAFQADQGDMNKLAAFDKLGINVSKFINLNADQQFRIFSDALGQVANSSQRAQLGWELMGRGAETVYGLLLQGQPFLEDAARMTELLGTRLNGLDSQKVLDAQRAYVVLQEATSGLFKQLSVQLAPVMSEVSSIIVKQIDEWGGMEAISRTVMDGIVAGMGVVLQVMDGFELVWKGLKVGFYALKVVVMTVFSGIVAFVEASLQLALVPINGFIRTYNKLADKLGKDKLDPVEVKILSDDTKLQLITDAAGETKAAWADMMVTLDKPPATDRVIKWVDHATGKWTEVAKAEVKATEESRKYGEIVTSQFDKAAQAIKNVKKELMSLDTVADKGGRSVNAAYARQALKFREKSQAAEARGQFDLADRYRAQADKFGGLVNRRQLTEDQILGMKEQKGGTVQVPMSDSERARELHRQASVAYGRRQFITAAKLDQDAKRLDKQNAPKTRRAASGSAPATPSSESSPSGSAPSSLPAEKGRGGQDATDSTPGLIAEVSALIAELRNLPNKLGVV